MLELLKAPFLLINFSYYTLVSPFLITLSAMTMILHSTRKCAQVSDLQQQLEVVWDPKPDLWDSVAWGRKWIVHFSAGKTQLVSFDQSNNSGAIDLKINGSAFEESSSFKMLWLSFSYKLDWDSCIVSIDRTLFMVVLSANWIFWINYRNRYEGLLSFTCCLSWTLDSSQNITSLIKLFYRYYFSKCSSGSSIKEWTK